MKALTETTTSTFPAAEQLTPEEERAWIVHHQRAYLLFLRGRGQSVLGGTASPNQDPSGDQGTPAISAIGRVR